MDKNELRAKIRQIEEQARLTLAEYPNGLPRERQQMIIALARYIRCELEPADATQPVELADTMSERGARH